VTVELEPTLERDIEDGQKNDENINEIWQLILDVGGLRPPKVLKNVI
jgi:hypothetical protein